MLRLSSKRIRELSYLALIWLLAGGIGFYIRMYPLRHFVSSDANELASTAVVSQMEKIVSVLVKKQHPEMSVVDQAQLSQEEFNRLLHEKQAEVRANIYRVGRAIDKEHPPQQRYPYLLASDGFYYFGLTQQILKTGKISEHIRGSKFFHPLMMAPEGYWEPLNLHPYTGALVHHIVKFFDPETSLMFSVSFVGPILALICLIPFLVICRFFRCSGWATFVGAVYFMLIPIFLKRSCFAWYDDDPYNVFFPLLILAILFYGFRKAARGRHFLILAGATVVAMMMYALYWHGWVFFETVLLISGLLIISYNHLIVKEKQDTRHLATFTASILVGALVGIGLLFGPNQFFVLFDEGWTALNAFLFPHLPSWPDLYISVGELKNTSWSEWVRLCGGPFVFLMACVGLVDCFVSVFRSRDRARTFALITLLVFSASALFLALGAQRFVMISAVPVSIFFVLGIQRLFSLIPWGFGRWIPRDRFLSFKIHFTLAVLALELILIPMRQTEANFPTLLDPIFNSCWARALVKIRVLTPPESIVNSWWPPGHFIKAVAERRVTFDGATINKPQGYWMASIFLSQTERQAAGLLRMLNDSANEAAEYLQALGWSLPESVALLQSITPLNRKAAQAYLDGTQLTETQVQGLLDLTHRTPPPTYLMIYNDLVEKSIQLNFVGDWNFRKAAAMDRDPNIQKTIRGLSRSNYAKFLWSLSSGGPLRASEPLPLAAETPDGRLFQDGVYITSQYDCRIKSATFGQGIPLSLFYMTPHGIEERRFPNATLSYSVVLVENRGLPRCFLMDRRLANSLIMKLFYFDGKGLRYFEPMAREKDLTGRTEIAVFRVNWENFLEDIDQPGPAIPPPDTSAEMR